MTGLNNEADKVVEHEYKLAFKYPSSEEIAKIKRLHRDMPEAEKMAIESDLEGLQRLLKRVENGDIDPDHLPKEMSAALKRVTAKR